MTETGDTTQTLSTNGNDEEAGGSSKKVTFLGITVLGDSEEEVDDSTPEEKQTKKFNRLIGALTTILLITLMIILCGKLVWGHCMEGFYLEERFNTCAQCSVRDCARCPNDECWWCVWGQRYDAESKKCVPA